MLYRALADLLLVLHLGFIAFVLVGGFLALRWRYAPILHLPAAVWAVFIELSGGICPLTPFENALRRKAGIEGYSGGFIEHYLLPLVYPSGLTASVQTVLAAVVLVLNAIVYVLVFRRLRSRRSRLGA